jgi:hypothetical protein
VHLYRFYFEQFGFQILVPVFNQNQSFWQFMDRIWKAITKAIEDRNVEKVEGSLTQTYQMNSINQMFAQHFENELEKAADRSTFERQFQFYKLEEKVALVKSLGKYKPNLNPTTLAKWVRVVHVNLYRSAAIHTR